MVVLAVIAVLVALLLPVLQRPGSGTANTVQQPVTPVRSGAAMLPRRHGRLPFGLRRSPRSLLAAVMVVVDVLTPYLEQRPLYDRLRVTSGSRASSNPAPPDDNTRIVLSTFVCPSDAGPMCNHRKGGMPSRTIARSWAIEPRCM